MTTDAPSKKIGGRMFVLAWLLLLGMLAIYFNAEERRQFNPNADPDAIDVNGKQTLVLKANRQKHFVMTGSINNIPVTFMLDTGATNVAIPANMAAKLGLESGAAGTAMTANGPVTVYSTRIEKLHLGHIVLHDVSADLNPGMNNGAEILLGMSALSQIEFSQRDGMLLLTQ